MTSVEMLYDAVRWALDRAQTDPEFRWHMIGTETLDRLVRAEAAYLGRDANEVKAERTKDDQPEHRRRRPACAVNRDRLEVLERVAEAVSAYVAGNMGLSPTAEIRDALRAAGYPKDGT